jgi:hypothetical protein
LFRLGYVLGSRGEGALMARLVWRVKLVAELEGEHAILWGSFRAR